MNCDRGEAERNDIHVALMNSPTQKDLCKSVTAEISAHFRPVTWTPKNLETLRGVPVRITGQLLFDAIHKPCKDGEGRPRRVSVWEIHPVYAIDVCKNAALGSCSAADTSKWVSLEAWLNQTEEPDE